MSSTPQQACLLFAAPSSFFPEKNSVIQVRSCQEKSFFVVVDGGPSLIHESPALLLSPK
jgi:hypothetical protein